MAVEKIYQPYDEATQTSIPQRQPQSSPEKQTVKRKVVVPVSYTHLTLPTTPYV